MQRAWKRYPVTQFSADGTAYSLLGAESAPVVVLIHGLGLNRDITWADFLAPLSKHYRVLSYDLCGHGQSGLSKEQASLSVLARQLADLLDELGIERASLLGFSLGGMINRRFAMDYPSRVESLVILNSPHQRDPEAQRLVEERARNTDEGGIEATIDTTLERWFTPAFRANNASRVQQVREVVLANDLQNYVQHRQVLAVGVTELIKPNPPIPHACLVISCEHDSGSTPAMSHAISAEIPGSQTVIVQSLQHLGLLERPDLFLDPILSFLQQKRLIHS